jgi:hypothetical protein
MGRTGGTLQERSPEANRPTPLGKRPSRNKVHGHQDQTDKHHQSGFGIYSLIVIVYFGFWRRVVVRVSVIVHVL